MAVVAHGDASAPRQRKPRTPKPLGIEGSPLPTFIETIVPDTGGKWYTCTRCDESFYVQSMIDNVTAPCPHCFKVSKVP